MTLADVHSEARLHALPLTLVEGGIEHACRFSVCTLLRRPDSYQRLLTTFAAKGFTSENSEFLAVNNTDANRFDGYEIVRRLLPDCRGEYVIFCHDDIELIDDGFEELSAALRHLDKMDDKWVVAGVAGGDFGGRTLSKKLVLRISDKYGSRRDSDHSLPSPAMSLDECFVVMRRSCAVFPSLDLGGFHFYGTDICLQARLAGGSCYVIPFHLMHHGEAKRDKSFWEIHDAVRRKYRDFLGGEFVHTTTEVIPMVGDLRFRAMMLWMRLTRKLKRSLNRIPSANR